MAMIVTSLVMAAMIAIGIYAFVGLQRQERERVAARKEPPATAASQPEEGARI